MIGREGLLRLVALVARAQAAHGAVREEGSSPCPPHPSLFPPPWSDPELTLWARLPQRSRTRLLWLLSQLVERQLRDTRTARKEAEGDLSPDPCH